MKTTPQYKLNTCFRTATELTFVLKCQKSQHDWEYDGKLYRVDLEKLKKDTLQAFGSHLEKRFNSYNLRYFIDCGCVEVAHTPDIFEENLLQLYSAIYVATKQNNLVPLYKTETKTEIFYNPTGGGHVHCDIPISFFRNDYFFEDFACFEHNLMVSYINNPYLLWLFRYPFMNDSMLLWTPDKIKPEKLTPLLSGNRGIVPRYRNLRSKAVMPTVEFRLFDAPLTAEIAILQQNFAKRWLAYIAQILVPKNTKLEIDLDETKFNKYKTSLKFVKESFKKFLVNLEMEDKFSAFEYCFENWSIRKRYGSF